MMQPKRTKFRKAHKGRIKGKAKGGTSLNFGSHGLKAVEPDRLTARQIEAARRAITRHMKRAGRVWIRIFPDVPVSSKPAEVRMGSGKGSPEFWVARVKPGRIMFELDGVTDQVAKEALELGAAKLPIKTRGRDPDDVRPKRLSAARAVPLIVRLPRMTAMKAKEVRGFDAGPAGRSAAGAQEGAVQSALPAGVGPAREYVAGPRRPPRYCTHQDDRPPEVGRRPVSQGLRR